MRCPSCGKDNIPGVELCERCGSDLAGLDVPEASGGFAGRLMTDRIDSLQMTPPLTVAAEDSVEAAIRTMRQARHGFVLVCDGERLIGIFTEKDVLTHVVCRGVDASATPVRQVMTPRPTTLTGLDPPAWAIHRMVSQGFRHLPILDGGRLAGSISVRNILRYIHQDVLSEAG